MAMFSPIENMIGNMKAGLNTLANSFEIGGGMNQIVSGGFNTGESTIDLAKRAVNLAKNEEELDAHQNENNCNERDDYHEENDEGVYRHRWVIAN